MDIICFLSIQYIHVPAPEYNTGGKRCGSCPRGLLGQRGVQCQVRAWHRYKWVSLQIESYFHVNAISCPFLLSVEPRMNHWQHYQVGEDKGKGGKKEDWKEERFKNRKRGITHEGREKWVYI